MKNELMFHQDLRLMFFFPISLMRSKKFTILAPDYYGSKNFVAFIFLDIYFYFLKDFLFKFIID